MLQSRQLEPRVKVAPLSREEEYRLACLWRDEKDVKALHTLILSNLSLVVKIAQEYTVNDGLDRGLGPSLHDLIQEGNLGLVIAARKYDPERSVRFYNYAPYWIRACILKHILESFGQVRVGKTPGGYKLFFNIGKAQRELAYLGKEETPEAIAKVLDIPVKNVKDTLPSMFSRNVALNEDDADELVSGTDTPDKLVEDRDTIVRYREILDKAMKKLNDRERFLIKTRHFGAGGEEEKTRSFLSLTKELKLSHQRLREIYNSGMKKLKRALIIDGWRRIGF